MCGGLRVQHIMGLHPDKLNVFLLLLFLFPIRMLQIQRYGGLRMSGADDATVTASACTTATDAATARATNAASAARIGVFNSLRVALNIKNLNGKGKKMRK